MSHTPGEGPYAPPQSQLRELVGPPSAERLATSTQRFVNYAIDYLGVVMVYVAFLLWSGSAAGPQRPGRDLLASLAIYAGYYFAFESLGGATPGKWVTGTRVVAEDGTRPRSTQLLIRAAARLIPLEPFSYLGPSPPVGWHDSFSHTRVIRLR